MKWQGRRKSSNIEDRRRMSGGKAGGLGGIGLIAVLLIGAYFNVDVSPLLEDAGVETSSQSTALLTQEEIDAGNFVAVTLADTEEVWGELLPKQVGVAYNPAIMVLFRGTTQSACGGASGATGPFYCPPEKKIYLDTEFFMTLSRRLGAKGDFAAAYVVAHEAAHHVQNELGILGQANKVRAQASKEESNAISVRIELQADCFSGIWARHAQRKFGSLERGDVEEAMNAAKQIGDDTLQRNAGQRPMPHTFTHGTSEQRQRWFAKGYESGQMEVCDTFGARRL